MGETENCYYFCMHLSRYLNDLCHQKTTCANHGATTLVTLVKEKGGAKKRGRCTLRENQNVPLLVPCPLIGCRVPLLVAECPLIGCPLIGSLVGKAATIVEQPLHQTIA